MKTITQSALAAAVAAATASAAHAGGYAVREQSAFFQGSSFAGSAAGGSLSSMYWNSAAITEFSGLNSYSSYSLILPDSVITGSTFAGNVNLGLPNSSGDIGDTAIVPASYMSYQLSENLYLGAALNAPFGLTTDPSNFFWAGQTFARESKIETYDFNPTLAYKLSDTLSIGVGLQVNYMKAQLRSASGISPASRPLVVKGDDWGFGFTAGIMFTPTAGTSIGLGYRSQIDHTLEGNIRISGSPVAPARVGTDIEADTTLPDIVTLSLRHALSPNWTLLGTVEWTNWSEVQKLAIVCSDGPNVVFCPAGAGQQFRALELGWHDSWFFAAGLEHQYSDQLTLRAGIAYEKSPIQEATERTLRLPDADRIWLSAGASYKWSENMTFDLAYTHIFIEDGAIDRTESGLRFIGEADGHVDILSVGVKSKLDWLLSGG